VASSTAPTGTGADSKGRNGTADATALADALDDPDVQAFVDCLGQHGVDVPDFSSGDLSLQWQDGKLTINGTTIDLPAAAEAFEACKADVPAPDELPGIFGELGPFGKDARGFADCLRAKGFDFPFAGGAFAKRADPAALIKALEVTASALRSRLDPAAGSDVEQRLAALDAAIAALEADAANAPEADPGTKPSMPDMSTFRDALESCKAELAGD
jgi:hypothetical protein